jgi:SAM-dependent methyltransferase
VVPPRRSPTREDEEVAAFLGAAGIVPPAKILDVPCGIGRRAFALAERGYRVTAVDPNEVAVHALKGRAPMELASRLEFRHAARDTLPGPPISEEFQAILCLDHAVGRDAVEGDAAFLRRLRGHLAPAGLLLLELMHRDFFASRPRPFAYHVVGDVEQHEFRSFDPLSGVLTLTWRLYQREGPNLRFRGGSSARLNLLAPEEARQLLETSGWHVQAMYGGWNQEPVSPDRRKLILVARPAARS